MERIAEDLAKAEKALLLATQPQNAGSIFVGKPTSAAWHGNSVSSYFLVNFGAHFFATPKIELSTNVLRSLPHSD
jgi:hypothetical protein